MPHDPLMIERQRAQAQFDDTHRTIARKALDAELAALTRLHDETARCEDALIEAERLRRRVSQLEARLATVLRLAQAERLWVGIPDGAVWSRRRARPAPERERETR